MMKRVRYIIIPAAILLLLGGCVTMPTGPSVMVLPAPGKSFENFQIDDVVCRQWSRQQIGMEPQEVMNQNMISGAAVGTAVGAGIGAVIGAASGRGASGAAVGAATGALIGTSSGANAGQVYGWEAQHRYDIAYQQCMYAKGNVIPGTQRIRRSSFPPPPPPPPGQDYATPDASQPYWLPPPASPAPAK